MSKKICVVIGLGPGLGSAYARRFSEGGYQVALLGRTQSTLDQYASMIENSMPVVCDVSDRDSVRAAFEIIRTKLGNPSVVIQNAGSGVFKGFMETTAQELRDSLSSNIEGLFHVAKEALPFMVEQKQGSIIVTGATAAWRGSAKTSAFAAAKGGQRWLTQALAKEFAPKGVHISYIIVDGIVDMPRTRQWMPNRPSNEFIAPSAVAETAWFLAHQPNEAWTFELDVRPAPEKW